MQKSCHTMLNNFDPSDKVLGVLPEKVEKLVHTAVMALRLGVRVGVRVRVRGKDRAR